MANTSKNKQKNIAKHIAIIMDGNGRWAISNSLAISKGHSKGVEVVKEIVEESVKQNVSSLTLYAYVAESLVAHHEAGLCLHLPSQLVVQKKSHRWQCTSSQYQ